MTEQDLRLKYKQERGEYPASTDSLDLPESGDYLTVHLVDYIEWLENKVLETEKLLEL